MGVDLSCETSWFVFAGVCVYVCAVMSERGECACECVCISTSMHIVSVRV